MESLKKLQERLKGVKWMGPNGETYGSYSEYLEGAWGYLIPARAIPTILSDSRKDLWLSSI